MIVTLNSDNPADAELIERLFAPAVPAAQLSLDLAPPAPVAPVAAETPATVPPPPSVLPEPPAAPPSVDASGLPWDARIHSESKATVADGTWRKRRGADPELVKQVEAELRGESPAAAVSASAPTVADIPAPPAPAVVPPPPAAVPLAPAPAPETAPARTLADLSAAVAQGKIKMTDLIEQAQAHGCADVVALTNNPSALAAVIAFYDQQGLFQ
jgi:hypothetical protein